MYAIRSYYELSPGEQRAATSAKSDMPRHLRGRTLFREEDTYTRLTQRLVKGAEIKKTNLTDEFTYEDFLGQYGELSVPRITSYNVCYTKLLRCPEHGALLSLGWRV